jgi:hypothetical protein
MQKNSASSTAQISAVFIECNKTRHTKYRHQSNTTIRHKHHSRFQFLMAVNMLILVFWVVTPCCLHSDPQPVCQFMVTGEPQMFIRNCSVFKY